MLFLSPFCLFLQFHEKKVNKNNVMSCTQVVLQPVSKRKEQLTWETVEALKRTWLSTRAVVQPVYLSVLSTDTACQLDVFGHDSHTLGVDGAQVDVLKQTHQVGLAGFLQGHDSRALEAQVGLEILGDFTDQTLERQLAYEQLCALLVTTDFTQSHGTWPEAKGFLHTGGDGYILAGEFNGQPLKSSFSSSWYLFSTSHCAVVSCQNIRQNAGTARTLSQPNGLHAERFDLDFHWPRLLREAKAASRERVVCLLSGVEVEVSATHIQDISV